MNSVSRFSEVPLLPRKSFFGHPARQNAKISPDGRFLSWLAPVSGVMNLWVAPIDDPSAARQVTHDKRRGVQSYSWSFDGVFLLYAQDSNGDENYHLFALPAKGGEVRDLTPYEGVRAFIVAQSDRPGLRGTLLVSMNLRDPVNADLYLLDIASGEHELVFENGGFASYVVDASLKVRLVAQMQTDGGVTYLKWDGDKWKAWLTIPAEDARTTRVSHLDVTGELLYLYDSRGRDKIVLVSLAFQKASGDEQTPALVAQHPLADISGAWLDRDTYRPQFCTAAYERQEYIVVDENIRDEVDFLQRQLSGTWLINSRSEDDRYWIVGVGTDRVPGAASLYDRVEKRLQPLYLTRPDLNGLPLARMQSTTIMARDGLAMVSYLTLPLSDDDHDQPLRARSPVPLVLLVHGGPWARDSYGFNPYHQWLANRGYAVLSVNFRGSTGFGKQFVNAGDGEWGGQMDDDLCDAVDWAIQRGIADPGRVAIMGASYGGYATLWAMTQHSDRYACGVDIVGPSNLETFLETIPVHWEVYRAQLHRSIGNPQSSEGLVKLRASSPLTHAHRIAKPLLIGQGANDPRVKQAESDQMVEALTARGVPVTYVVFPDEGHGFAKPSNSIAFNIMVERFLAAHLGGKFLGEEAEEAAGNSAIVISN